MTPEEIKSALLKMNDDFWHKRNVDASYEIYADDVVFQRPPFPPVAGKEANRAADEGMLAAFSEIRSTVNECVVQGDTGVLFWSWDAVHTGTLHSLGLPATGKRIQFSGISLYRFKDGRVVQQWEFGDLLGFLQQLGVIPAFG